MSASTENVKFFSKLFLACCLVMVFFAGLAFFSGVINLGGKAFFAPKNAAIDRKVFKESTSYNEGMQQQLIQAQIEYIKATPDQKQALRPVLIHQFSVYPYANLSPELKNFYDQLRNGN